MLSLRRGKGEGQERETHQPTILVVQTPTLDPLLLLLLPPCLLLLRSSLARIDELSVFGVFFDVLAFEGLD